MLEVKIDKDDKVTESTQEMRTTINAVEKKNKHNLYLSIGIGSVLFSALFFGLGFGLMSPVGVAGAWLIATFVGVAIGIIIGTTVYSLVKMHIAKKNPGFTKDIVESVLGNDVTYEPDNGISFDTLKTAGLFPTDIIMQGDHFFGTYDGIDFESADISAEERVTRKSKMKGLPVYPFSAFEGTLFIIDMKQEMAERVIEAKVNGIRHGSEDKFDKQFRVNPLTSEKLPERYIEKITEVTSMFPNKCVFKTSRNYLYIAVSGPIMTINVWESNKITEENRRKIVAQLELITKVLKA